VAVKIASYSMSGMCCGQNLKLKHECNVSWAKLSVSACLVCVMLKIVSFMVKIVSLIMSNWCNG
jgi:hypothetical protein